MHLPSCRVEVADSEFAPRPRALLVAVEDREPRGYSGIAQQVRVRLVSRAPHADEVDLRGGDAASELEAPRAGLRPGDRARQRGNVVRQRRIAQGWQAQAVAAGVARRDRFSGGRSGAGARERIGAISRAPAAHAASAACCAASILTSASSTSSTVRRSVRAKLARWRSISRKTALRRASAAMVMRSMRSIS